jgi:hypothetical protein
VQENSKRHFANVYAVMRMGAKYAVGFNSRRLHHFAHCAASEPEIKNEAEIASGLGDKIV